VGAAEEVNETKEEKVQGRPSLKGRTVARTRELVALAMLFLLIAGIGTGVALADESPEQIYGVRPTAEDSERAMKEGPALELPTDLGAAEEMPHQNLDRGEALDLLNSVFGAELEGAAGPFAELEVDRFLSDNVAVVDSGTLSVSSTSEDSKGEGSDSDSPVLLESTIPLRAEDASGEEQPLALGLEHTEGELQPENPLVEVGVPTELGEGIALPEAGITISPTGLSDERSPTTLAQATAVYPNVAEDSDLVVAPTPTGVETFEQLRSPNAPSTQAYHLGVPAGASLKATEEGGAEVTRAGETLMTVPAPTALDAAGNNVATDLQVSGESMSIQVMPDESTVYPILVDPLFEAYNWTTNPTQFPGEPGKDFWNFGGWISATNTPYAEVSEHEIVGPYNRTGLSIVARSGIQAPGQGNWNYYVPRMTSDYTKYGVRPKTYINGAVLQQLEFKFWAGYEPNGISRQSAPYFQGGIWDSINGGWIQVASRNGVEGELLDPSYSYNFPNVNHNVNGKNFGVGLLGLEPFTQKWGMRSLYVGIASMELTDNDAPSITYKLPSEWVNNQPTAVIPFEATDLGLGAYKMVIEQPWGAGKKTIETKQGCVGGVYHPCPRTWSNTDPSSPQIAYEPAAMPTGEDWIKIAAVDPIGHSSKENENPQAEVRIKVDHAAPSLALTGPITEQASLGTSRPSYELEINSSDGTAEKPQSGVAKTAIEIDGKLVSESAPGCTTQNCSVSRKWTLESSQYSTGGHVLKVISTDAVGNAVTKTQGFNLQPASPPSVALSGTATQQATLGTSRPRYALNVNASTEAGFSGMPFTQPSYVSSFGATGSGIGQFTGAMGTAIDSKGNLWMVDQGNGRVEEFNAKGEYLFKFGEPGPNPGQLKMPSGLAIDSSGNFWVANSDSRISEFSSEGKFVRQWGKEGTADGAMSYPVDIAIDSKNNLWIVDNGNNRVQEFNPEGKFITKFGTQGSGAGQFQTPWGIAIGSGGNIWVADTWNNRLEKFDSTGKYLGQFGEGGQGNGNFALPTGIRTDSAGNLYVTEGGNNRVQVLNSNAEYLTQFGTTGTSPGQFTYPSYVSVDPAGNIYVHDSYNRIQRWRAQTTPPNFSLAFGSKGTGAGQFTTPSGVTTDSAGNVWVVDRGNARIEKFNAKGEFQSQFGTKGSGAGQLSNPWGVAIDTSGNVWVTDTTNVRVVEFNAKGEFVATFGTNVNKTKVEAGGTQAEKNLCTAASKSVCQAGTAGSAEGQMKEPTGIATSSGGNIYVVEKGNGRVEKFSPTGEKLAKFGGPGSGNGQFSGPTGIAVAPDGSLWVADAGNSRIEQWTSTYSFVQAVGKEGSGNGQFYEEPYGLSIDSQGNLWVADTWGNRIQEFNSNGDFLTKFGKSGTGEGQFSVPYALSADASGNIWIVDTGHNQIQKWIAPTSRASTITSEITVDGTPVNTKVGRCGTETCSIAPEWTLEASSYAVGKHTIQVKATDGLGRSTTKTQAIELQKDETKPALETAGTLATAPEGWVEQQGYNLSATATDAGYGVTSLIAKIDGKEVASWTGACIEGGCKATISKVIDMSAYSGGSHPAEVIATDGAGNVTKKAWTINVDPEGHISTEEAIATLEAVDNTSPSNTVGTPKEEEELPGTAPELGMVSKGTVIAGTGTSAPISVNNEPGGSFSVEIPEPWATESCFPEEEFVGEPEEGGTPAPDPKFCETENPQENGLVGLEVDPTKVAGGANSASLVGGHSVVSGNTESHVDTIVRPLYDGAITFSNIRDESAPAEYSWEVALEADQELKQVDSQHVQVYYKGGHPGFTITAEPAHDAIGTTVPTTLSITKSNVVTLHVNFKGEHFTYPIIAGTGWQGGFTTYEVEMPPPQALPGEEKEEWEELGVTFTSGLSYDRIRLSAQGPPLARPGLTGHPFTHRYKFSECRFQLAELPEIPQPERRPQLMVEIEGSCMKDNPDEHILAGMSLRGWYWYKSGVEIWVNKSEEECIKWGPYKPAKVNCEAVPSRDPHHVVLYGNFRFPPGTIAHPLDESECDTLWAVLTVAAPHKHDREPLIDEVPEGEPCDWPQK
jgi:tripartite motif-containing protein 71